VLKVNVDFDILLTFVPGTKTPAGVRGRGDTAGAKRRGGSTARPRTARAWNGNQQTSLTQPMKKRIRDSFTDPFFILMAYFDIIYMINMFIIHPDK